jgi:hypothetical protein
MSFRWVIPPSGPHLQPLITVLGKQLEGLCKAACSKKRGFWIDDAAEGCIFHAQFLEDDL